MSLGTLIEFYFKLIICITITEEPTKQSEQLEHLPLDVKSDCLVILNKHCLLIMTGGTLKFSA
ncbi:hypothetical protein MICAB_7090002 [Microcystis aeruginosa PCC 9717]|uniref:Uncharacterized protein n=1 Tax=Microcystis aeruginosa PCC 9717 TaxID=1160286 RepID=I4FWF1_MICAE|nr:hypothetical protein MICAB_7090002 [Microcystis aeruginosa PCC 9717]